MKLKGGFKNIFFLIIIPLLGYSKIELFSLRERPIMEPKTIETPPLEEEKKEPPKKIIKPKKKIIKPKKMIKKIEEEVKIKEPETQTIFEKETITTFEKETMPFEIFEEELKEEKTPLWVFFSLAITSFCGIVLLYLIFIHLKQREKRPYKPLSQVPPSDIKEELKNLKQSSKMVSSQVEEIEKMVPREFLDALRSGKVFSQIVKDVSAFLEPRIRELGLAYQAIKKSITQLESEIQELSSLKGLNFKSLARQTSTEFIIPIKNEFEKARLHYENIISSFEQRQKGRLSTIEKRYLEVKESVDEVYKRLVGLESIITSATMFEQEPIIWTKKREETISPPQTSRREINNLIYELADEGLSVDEIAKKTKIGKGEISLILSFRKKVS